ncbi:MAG: acylphosphatase [Burkholderiales bacterium]
MPVCKHLGIYGRVQGVGFRYAFADRANELGLTGWVRNRFDGSVEAVVQGEPDAVEQMIKWTKSGPDFARVDRVEASEAEGNFRQFEIRGTN